MAKLTKRQIEALEPTKKDYFVRDTELSDLGTRAFPTGRKQVCLAVSFRKDISPDELG